MVNKSDMLERTRDIIGDHMAGKCGCGNLKPDEKINCQIITVIRNELGGLELVFTYQDILFFFKVNFINYCYLIKGTILYT